MNDNFYSQSAERLKSERVRLGLKQAGAGDLCGVTREQWGKYERGQAVPGGEVLFSFAAAGADVSYILTGVRCIPEGAHQAQERVLSPRQAALLDNYEHTDEKGRAIIEATAFAAAQPLEVKTGTK